MEEFKHNKEIRTELKIDNKPSDDSIGQKITENQVEMLSFHQLETKIHDLQIQIEAKNASQSNFVKAIEKLLEGGGDTKIKLEFEDPEFERVAKKVISVLDKCVRNNYLNYTDDFLRTQPSYHNQEEINPDISTNREESSLMKYKQVSNLGTDLDHEFDQKDTSDKSVDCANLAGVKTDSSVPATNHTFSPPVTMTVPSIPATYSNQTKYPTKITSSQPTPKTVLSGETTMSGKNIRNDENSEQSVPSPDVSMAAFNPTTRTDLNHNEHTVVSLNSCTTTSNSATKSDLNPVPYPAPNISVTKTSPHLPLVTSPSLHGSIKVRVFGDSRSQDIEEHTLPLLPSMQLSLRELESLRPGRRISAFSFKPKYSMSKWTPITMKRGVAIAPPGGWHCKHLAVFFTSPFKGNFVVSIQMS